MIFESNIGLFPEFINHKEIKVLLSFLKEIDQKTILGFQKYLSFTEFKDFIKMCSIHWATLKIEETK